MKQALPRLMFCAPGSGGGKTTVTCAVLRALLRRGMKPVSFKCGPDFIDPMFHSEVVGAKSRNLDLFLIGARESAYLLWENGRAGDLCVLEGAMGYYDGIAMTDRASAWDLACETQTPAILVLDGRGSALTAAAVVRGMQTFREPSRIKGVLLNRISPSVYPRLKDCIEGETGVPVFGYLPNLPECALESRHLGLVTAAEVENLRGKMDVLADEAARTVDLDGLLRIAADAPHFIPQPPELPPAVEGRPRIAVARDEAFCFYYEDSFDLLRRLGATLEFFSPLRDRALPPGSGGLYLGGGYPELYVKALSDNRAMRSAVQSAVSGGMPTWAECGGFLYLHRALEGEDGARYPMAGVFAFDAYRTQRLTRFGYVTLHGQANGLLGPVGIKIPAHEFHYWDSEAPGEAFVAKKPYSDRQWQCGYSQEFLYAGFPHIHLWAARDSARRFVCAALDYQTRRGRPA